jgi:hypothetical protein
VVTAQAHAQQSIETLATAHVGVLVKRRRQRLVSRLTTELPDDFRGADPNRDRLALTGRCVLLPSLDGPPDRRGATLANHPGPAAGCDDAGQAPGPVAKQWESDISISGRN